MGLEAAVEDEADGEEVGTEETADDEGDDGVEGGGGADVDEGEKEGDYYSEGEGVERKFAAGFDLGVVSLADGSNSSSFSFRK